MHQERINNPHTDINEYHPQHLMPKIGDEFCSLDVHRQMIFDAIRTAAFRDAIMSSIHKGDVVIDLGTGTGMLAVICAQAGASRVFALESLSIAEVAKQVVAGNGFNDVITILQDCSKNLTLPVKANVIVAEIVGHFLLEEGILEYLPDAVDRFLANTGCVIPLSGRTFVVPIESPELFDNTISIWKQSPYGVDLSVIATAACNNVFVVNISPFSYLSDPQQLFNVSFTHNQEPIIVNELEFKAQRKGFCHGFGGWFEIQLTPNIALNTSPESKYTHWQQCFFPLSKPIAISEGSLIKFKFEQNSTGSDVVWNWVIDIIDNRISSNYISMHSTIFNRPQDQRGLKRIVLDRTRFLYNQRKYGRSDQ